MSRLIFEGDTTERFGKLFPKPFIQEIRVYDDAIQADVMLFLEVPLEQAETDNLIGRINENLRVFGAFLEQDQFNRTINPNSQSNFYKNSFFALHFNINDYEITEPLQNIEYHYNSEGKRFAKCLVTFEYTEIAGFLNLQRDRYFAAFTSFTSPSSELEFEGNFEKDVLSAATKSERALYRNQTSDLVYEKILNADGTLNTGKQNAYQEPDGNYYGKTPLQSLGKIYKQTNKITHQRVIDLVNPVVSPYVGSIPEADKISMTLSQYSNDPALLTQLEKDINSFTNKSSATTTGQLYSQLVDVVADIDNLLQAETTLNKRLETNTKIKDRRGDRTFISSVDSLNTTLTSESAGEYIYLPFVSRYLKPAVSTLTMPVIGDEFIVKNLSYIFFDYEKNLNYESRISNYFNPYNLKQIFGVNCFNNYYRIKNIMVEKFAYHNRNKSQVLEQKVVYSDSKGYEEQYLSRNLSHTEQNPKSFNDFSFSGGKTTYRQLIERAFDTVDGLNNYKFKNYEMVDLESAEQATNGPIEYRVIVEIEEKTMNFYDKFIKTKLETLISDLQRYTEFAEQFCSYNNLDNRFNDFFVNSIESEFEEPFVWENAPLYYYCIKALIESSWDDPQQISGGVRKKDGSLINMSLVKNNAILKSRQISPSSGDLSYLQEFLVEFTNFYNTYFGYEQGFDALTPSIYDDDSRGGKTLRAYPNKEFEKTFVVSVGIIDEYELEIEIPTIEETDTETNTSIAALITDYLRTEKIDKILIEDLIREVARQYDLNNMQAQQAFVSFVERAFDIVVIQVGVPRDFSSSFMNKILNLANVGYSSYLTQGNTNSIQFQNAYTNNYANLYSTAAANYNAMVTSYAASGMRMIRP